jgi:hypothetical protein
MRCNAHRSGDKKPCGKYAVKGREKCERHGGATPQGIASPHFKHGRFSRHLPTRIMADYHEYLIDPQRLELDDELSLVRARAVDLVKRVDTGESSHLWRELQRTFGDLTQAKNGEEQLAVITALGQLIQRGASDYAAWEDVGRQVDRTQRLVESQRKRTMELQHSIPMDQLNFIMTTLLAAIVKYVIDRETRANIQAEFDRAMSLAYQSRSAA